MRRCVSNSGRNDESEREMSEWINVKDRLPKLNQEILGYEKDIVYWGFYSQFGFLDTLEECERKKTTHWMPLPNPPKEIV